MDNDTPEIKAIRQRRATVIRLLRENEASKDSPDPHAREAIAALVKSLRDEKTAITGTLISTLQDRLYEVADEVARALGLNDKQREGYRDSAQQPVRLVMQDIERKHKDADHELHIKELGTALAEQAKLLQWAKDAKGVDEGGAPLGFEAYLT